jgi:hypothetical protein
MKFKTGKLAQTEREKFALGIAVSLPYYFHFGEGKWTKRNGQKDKRLLAAESSVSNSRFVLRSVPGHVTDVDT